MHVYTSPLESRVSRDVWVETVMAPPSVTADEQFPVEVHVYSQFPTSGTVDAQKRRRNPGIEDRPVWNEGLNRIAFSTRVKDETSYCRLSKRA